jgi:hypothetical protein
MRRNLGGLFALTASLLFTGCGTVIWDHNAFQSATVLKEGENEVEGHSFTVFPTNIGYARGIADRTELRVATGITGLFHRTEQGYPEQMGVPVGALDIGVTKTLVNSPPGFVSATGSAGGFYSHQSCPDADLIGGRLSVGANLACYPVSWFGLFAPLRIQGVLANAGNYYVCAQPGLGISIEPWRFVIRIAGSYPVAMLIHSGEPVPNGPDYQLRPNPLFLGLQLGYRWGGPED